VSRPFNYGGQAVIEGVMMRGSRSYAVAVRTPEGEITVHEGELNKTLYQGRLIKIPFLRGLVTLWDSLGLGMKALMMSADTAAGEDVSFEGPTSWITGAVGIGLGVGLFILLPSFLVGLLRPYIELSWLSSLLEGIVRLVLIVGYMWAVGRLEDIRRVFAYHGAEHRTINAYEAGSELTVEGVQAHSEAHMRCGTSFLLTLTMIAVVILAPLGRLPMGYRLLSRLLLLPVLAGIAYEVNRLAARVSHVPLVRRLMAPNLALQRLTTREPDDSMVEVAITALNAVLRSERIATAEAIA
jgi:uncharacterized protein YqhQ